MTILPCESSPLKIEILGTLRLDLGLSAFACPTFSAPEVQVFLCETLQRPRYVRDG
jgi:hypothetical protein